MTYPHRYDRTEQRHDAAPAPRDQPGDILRAEVFSESSGRPQSVQELNQKWMSVVSHLEEASRHAGGSDIESATKAYNAAFVLAESIDRVSVARERKVIREALKDSNLDSATRRKYLQSDSDLECAERAPGVALANWGLMLIREGDSVKGTQLLLQAQDRDHAMKDDPNFKRHLNDALGVGKHANSVTPDHQPTAASPWRAPELPSGFPHPVIMAAPPPPGSGPFERTATPPPVPAPLDQVTPQPPAPAPFERVTPPLPVPPPVDETAPRQVAPGSHPGDRAVPPPPVPGPVTSELPVRQEYARTANAYAQAEEPKVSKLDAQGRTPIYAAEALFAQVTSEKPLSDSAKQAFQATIANADAGVSPKLIPYLQRMEQAKGAAIEIINSNQQTLNAIELSDKAVAAIFDKLPAQQKTSAYLLYHQLDSASSSEERSQVKSQLESIHPQMKTLLAERDSAMGPRLVAALINAAKTYKDIEVQLQSRDNQDELNQSAITRFTYAQALAKSGQMNEARSLMVQALDMNKSTDANMNDSWRKTAMRMGIPLPADVVPGGPPTDVPPPAIPVKDKAADLLFQTNERFKSAAEHGSAEEAFKQATPDYLKAIARADQEFQETMRKLPEWQNIAAKPAAQLSSEQKAVLAQAELEVKEAITGRFLTRFYMAQAADRAGDNQQAKEQMSAALAAIPASQQLAFFEQSPNVVSLANKCGITKEKLPVAADALLRQSDPASDQAARKPRVEVSPSNEGLRPDQMLLEAKRLLRENGMTAETKKQFEETLKVADSLFGPQDARDIETVQGWLKSGRKDNGEIVTPAERVRFHKQIAENFQASTLGIQWRAQYAQLLTENKQNASAERILLERVKLADELPLSIYRTEMELLAQDMRNPNIAREDQLDMSSLLEQIGGSSTSRDDGLIYMPIGARKIAAMFYMSADGSEDGNGIFKPDLAIAMINDTKAVEKRVYGIDLNKNPALDPTLRSMAAKYEPFASEQMRKDKSQWDSYWSNGLIDVGVGAATLTAAGFIASLATKNPRYFGMALNADKTALNFGGKVALGSATLLSATASRNLLHQAVTGSNESWDKSFYHAAAGLGTFAAVTGARGALNRTVFAGASEESLLLRYANAKPAVVAEGGEVAASRVLTAGEVGEIYAARNLRVPQKTLDYIKANPDAVVYNNGALNSDVFEAVKLGLNPAQAANMASGVAPLTVAREAGATRSLWSRTPVNMLSPGALDLTTATAGQLHTRAFLGNWAQASAGIGAYESLAALDRTPDPLTGETESIGEAIWRANYRNAYDNTLTRGLLTGTFVFRNGAVPHNYYAPDANAWGRAWGTIKAPFTASRWGATTANSSYVELGKQAGYMTMANNMYDYGWLQNTFTGLRNSHSIGRAMDMSAKPIADGVIPGQVPQDMINVTPSIRQEAAPPAPPRVNTGDNLKDEPPPPPYNQNGQFDLTAGTPGLP